MPECPIAARQQDHLHALGGFLQDFRHQIEPAVVEIDQRIVEDQRNRCSLLQQHVGRGEAGQDR